MSTGTTAPSSNRKHIASAVAICVASTIAGGVGFEVWVAHIVRQLGDACPWGGPQDFHPVRVAAAVAVGAGLLALFGMRLRQTNLTWWVLLIAATLTVGAVGALACLGWFFIGDCLG